MQKSEPLDALRQYYVLKALECMSEEQKNEEMVALLQGTEETNLLAQIVQVLSYLPKNECSLLTMKILSQIFQNHSYVKRSHAIKFISCIPKEHRTVAALEKMLIFFEQTVDKCRYDIFRAIDKIPNQERYGVVEEVAQIVRNSDDWFLASRRAADLIEAIYLMEPKKRKKASFLCQQYPLIFFQEDIFSTLCFLS